MADAPFEAFLIIQWKGIRTATEVGREQTSVSIVGNFGNHKISQQQPVCDSTDVSNRMNELRDQLLYPLTLLVRNELELQSVVVLRLMVDASRNSTQFALTAANG